ncbi:Sensor protein ZraS [compost metagenome]
MSEQQLSMAFKPFYSTKRGGLGVGLSLVRRIMERFGGEVRVTSREHVGTNVCLLFRGAEGD